MCDELCRKLGALGFKDVEYETPKLLNKSVLLSDLTKNQISIEEQATIDNLWGKLFSTEDKTK